MIQPTLGAFNVGSTQRVRTTGATTATDAAGVDQIGGNLELGDRRSAWRGHARQAAYFPVRPK